jgi:hypothetical protein
MTICLGTVPASTTIYIPFATYAGSTGASVTMTGLAVTDIEIYKDGSATQRASDAGFSLLDTDGIDFDGITGIHGFSIDLSDNTDAGFYAVGSWYWDVVSAETVDSQTVNFIAAMFRIGPAESVAGYPKADVSHFGGTAGTFAAGIPEAKVASIAANAITAASIAADAITDAKVAADVTIASVTGAVGSVTGNVGGNVTGSVGSVASGGITSASFAAGAIDNAAIAADAIGSSELAATAVSEIATGVRSELATELARIDAAISSRALQADLAAVDAVTDKLDTMLQAAGGSPGDWEYRGDALRNLPPMVRQELAVELGRVDVAVSSRLAASAYTAPANSTIAEIAVVSEKLDTTLESASGSPGDWEFRADALRNAPTGSGGGGGGTDWTDGEREQIRHRLGIDGTASAPSATPSLATAAAVQAVDAVTDKLDTTLQAATGSPGDYEFRADALRHAPTGGLDAAGVRSAIGLASPNLDTQLSAIDSKTTNLPSDPADQSLVIAATTAIYDRIGAPAGASVSADVAAVKAQTAAIETDTQDLQSRVPAALVNGQMDSTNSDTVVRGTVGSASTTTSIVTSAFSPAGAAADQFKGRIVVFDKDTATAALRGQATDITASSSSATPVLTVTALTTAPSSGDTFSVL